MAKCIKAKELQIMTEDKAGMLAEVTTLVSSGGVNIEALCAYGGMQDNKATFLLVTNNNAKVKEAATSKGWGVEEHDVAVITIPDKVGTAKEVADKLKKNNISLLYCYVTTSGSADCRLVARAEDTDAIVRALG